MNKISPLVINKKFKKQIKLLQKVNKDHHKMMNANIERISSEIGLIYEQDREILWDHIYNENNQVKFK